MAMSRPVRPEDLALALECPVCHDHYHSPKMLPCGHTLCLSPCLEQITDGKPRLRCPECRTEHDVPEGGVEYFPTNIFAARLFETPKQSELILGCPICGEMEERVKCLHCGLLVCDECKHSHSIKFRDQLMELLKSLKEDKTPAAITSWELQKSKAEASVKDMADQSIRKIKCIADKAHDIITTTTQELISSVEDFSMAETKTIDIHNEDLEQNLQDVMGFCDIELRDLKRKLPSQAKMAKLFSSINTKQQAMKQNSLSLQQVLREINVATDIRPLEEAARNLAQIVVSQVQNITKQQEACGEVDEEKTNVDTTSVDKMNVATMTEAQPPARPGSVLLRDTSPVQLCISSQGSGDDNLYHPFRLVVDPETKDVIVADTGNHRIQIFDKDGKPKVRFGSNGTGREHLQNPTGVALTAGGNIIVTDTYNHRVKIHKRDGTLVRMFEQQGSGASNFFFPRGVAVDGSDGYIHVCDNGNKRVQVFEDNGKYKYQYNTWKSVCDESPQSISINRNGNIAVTLDTNIAVLNKQRQLLNSFKEDAWDVSWIDDDHLLVPDPNNHVLKVFTVSGELVKQFGEPGYCVGQLQCPRGVAVDEDGFVYVASRYNHMVQKF